MAVKPDAETVEKIKEEKPFRYIVQNLEKTFGEPKLGRKSDPLAKLIKNLLQQIKETRGRLSLKFVEKMSDEEARDFLSQFRGIGPKTVACTLLFACHKEVFPLDTHIFRV